jgi:hypothetical protein
MTMSTCKYLFIPVVSPSYYFPTNHSTQDTPEKSHPGAAESLSDPFLVDFAQMITRGAHRTALLSRERNAGHGAHATRRRS